MVTSFQFNCTKTCPDDQKYHVESDDPYEGLIVCASASHPKVQTRVTADKAEYVVVKADKAEYVVICTQCVC